jgi:hypothetical protein
MTPREKASQLIVDFQLKCKSLEYEEAVQCALIAVDEIYKNNTDESKNDYWIEVKKDLEKLK